MSRRGPGLAGEHPEGRIIAGDVADIIMATPIEPTDGPISGVQCRWRSAGAASRADDVGILRARLAEGVEKDGGVDAIGALEVSDRAGLCHLKRSRVQIDAECRVVGAWADRNLAAAVRLPLMLIEPAPGSTATAAAPTDMPPEGWKRTPSTGGLVPSGTVSTFK